MTLDPTHGEFKWQIEAQTVLPCAEATTISFMRGLPASDMFDMHDARWDRECRSSPTAHQLTLLRS